MVCTQQKENIAYKEDVIVTERLILRRANNEDDLSNYMKHVKEADEFMLQFGMEYDPEIFDIYNFTDNGVICFTILLKDTLEMVGYVGIKPYSKALTGELEYYIFREYRRNRYAMEALTEFIGRFYSGNITGFEGVSVHAKVIVDNEASCSMLEKMGFELRAVGIGVIGSDFSYSMRDYVRYRRD